MKHTESLSYVRKANARTIPSKGFVFRNIWSSGWQHLVFPTVEAARLWASARNASFTGPR